MNIAAELAVHATESWIMPLQIANHVDYLVESVSDAEASEDLGKGGGNA